MGILEKKMTQKITYPVKVKLKADFNKKLDSIELDLKEKLLLNPKLDVLDGAVLKNIVEELNESIEKAQLDFMQKLSKEYEKAVSSVSDAGISTPKVGKIDEMTGGAVAGFTGGSAAATATGLNFYTTVASAASATGHTATATAISGAGKVVAAKNAIVTASGLGSLAPVTIAEVVAAKLGVAVGVVTTAMTAGGAIIAAAGAAYLMNEFSKPEKRQEIKRALVKSYNDKIRPQLEDWAKEQIDLCNE